MPSAENERIDGICVTCLDGCEGPCEVGRSALKGREMIDSQPFGKITAGADKDYPVDFSHFDIQGTCVGAVGVDADPDVEGQAPWGLAPFVVSGIRQSVEETEPFSHRVSSSASVHVKEAPVTAIRTAANRLRQWQPGFCVPCFLLVSNGLRSLELAVG